MTKEIKVENLNPQDFIERKIKEIRKKVGKDKAITALSGGVDSSVVTILGHRALGKNLLAYFIDNGLMREGEPEKIVADFKRFGIEVKVADAKRKFLSALKYISDPEKKRVAIAKTFYKDVFGGLIKESGAKILLQGTILTDVEETVAGIKRQHNVFEQLGIDPSEEFGYKILEPLVQLRKDGVRKVAQALKLPESIYNRMPFPGPALAARIIGEVTSKKLDIVRMATAITENHFCDLKEVFQYMAILHSNRVTGVKNGQRVFGRQIEIRCWESEDARQATPSKISMLSLTRLAERITNLIPEVVSVTYNITSKPPSTMEAI